MSKEPGLCRISISEADGDTEGLLLATGTLKPKIAFTVLLACIDLQKTEDYWDKRDYGTPDVDRCGIGNWRGI